MTPVSTNDNLAVKAARAYLARGLAVFPLSGKVPLTEHGVKDATVDINLVETWFKQPRNIGIAIPDGYVVVDIDPRNGGNDSFVDWLDSYGDEHFEDVPLAHTGGGGFHYWYRLPAGITRLKKNPATGIDLLTVGRYVVAPPSETDAKYRWEIPLPQNLTDLPELPGYIAALGAIEDRNAAGVDIDIPRAGPYTTTGDPLDEAAHKATTWPDLLTRNGWRPVGDNKWRHPSSNNQFSATIRHDCLFVYSPNTPFDVTEPGDPHGVTLYRALETLDYRGDRRACLQALRDAGFLEDRTLPYANAGDLVASPSAPPNRPANPPQGTADNGDEGPLEPRLDLSAAYGIIPRRVRWLWDGRIPMGGLTLLAGREGEGKSTLAINTMAEVTRGKLDGEFYGEPKDVIMLATEDSVEHTIVPRLLAAGADLKRVFFIEMLEPTDTLTLPVHLPDLEQRCAQHDVAMIVMDPLLSRLGGNLDSHKDADVRRALEPLGKFADRVHAAILGLIHLNKSGSTDPLQAIMASRAFTAFARSVLFAMVDPNEEQRRLLGLVKSNLGRLDLPTLTYTFEPVTVGEDDGPIVATRIEWGENAPTSIRSALETSAISPEEKSALGDAAEWLYDYMVTQAGRCTARDALNAGKAAGHSERTIQRAFHQLKLDKVREGMPAMVWWVLPDAAVAPRPPRVPGLAGLAAQDESDIDF